jgi:hypothetical protein
MTPKPSPTSTSELAGSYGMVASTLELVPGLVWNSFEEFRKAGNDGLANIPPHGVALLNCKAGSYRIIRDVDFQRLVGLASDVIRLQGGVNIVMQAARIAIKHPDEDHIKLLLDSARLIAQCPELPQRVGHEPARLTDEELREQSEDDFDAKTAEIPSPSW